MQLLTKEIIPKLPPLYSTEGNGEAPVIVKFFFPVRAPGTSPREDKKKMAIGSSSVFAILENRSWVRSPQRPEKRQGQWTWH